MVQSAVTRAKLGKLMGHSMSYIFFLKINKNTCAQIHFVHDAASPHGQKK